MKISEKLKNGLDIVLNEAAILGLDLNEDENYLSCKLELLQENGSEIPNYVTLKLENLKRYISAYKTDIQNSKKIIQFHPNQIAEYLQNFIHKDIYGWEFFNVENSNFNFDKLSFEYITDTNYTNFNSLELFQEGFNDDLEIKIWFERVRFFDEKNNELNIEQLIAQQNKIWETIFKK